MTKTYDFDAWYDENDAAANAKTRPFRFGGRLWQIPVDPPAATLLRMERAWRRLAELDETAPEEQVAEVREAMDVQRLLTDLIGEPMVEEWASLPGVTMGKLQSVAWRLYRHYAQLQPLDDEPPDAEGEAPAPSTDATSSDGSSTTGA